MRSSSIVKINACKKEKLMLKKLGFYDLIKLFKYLRPRTFWYFLGLFGDTATEASLVLVVPIIIKIMVDASIKRDSAMLWKGFIIAGSEAIIASALFLIFIPLLWTTISRTMVDIKIKIVKHVLRLPVSYFEKNHSGDIISRLTNDVDILWGPLGWILRQIIFVTFSGVGSAIIMVLLDWRFGIILISMGICSTMLNIKFSASIRNISGKLQKAKGTLTEKVSDMFSGFVIMKMFQIEDRLSSQFSTVNDDVQKITLERYKKRAQLDAANFVISWINFGGTISIGALFYIAGGVEIGTVIGEINLLGNVNVMIRRLGGLIAELQSSLAGSSRVIELLSTETEPVSYDIPGTSKSNNMLEMSQVSFKYEEKPILSGISLSVKKGETIALVGGSGGGKSTIIKLFMGFYPTNEGTIIIDGKPLNKFTLKELRKMFAYVPQDACMFDGTIEENIRFGKPDATDEEVISAAKSAFAHEFIAEMPQQYKTMVGERGVRLSGGERQRIAIARAILKDAPILLLDEATSSLDSHSEQQVQMALELLMKGRTALIIAHRLSTIENSDKIYVIEDGRVVEEGRHHELLELSGTYSRMYNVQFKAG